MRERLLRLATVALALAGAAIAAYLSYTRWTDTTIMCPTTGCGTVQHSSYATLAGVPVAYLGVVGYLAIAATSTLRRVNVLLVVGAAAFGAYLLVAQLAFIHAVCVWCLGSDAVLLCLLVVAALGRFGGGRAVTRPERLPAGAPRARGEPGGSPSS